MDAERRAEIRKHHAIRGLDDRADPIIAGPRLRRMELLDLLDVADERDRLAEIKHLTDDQTRELRAELAEAQADLGPYAIGYGYAQIVANLRSRWLSLGALLAQAQDERDALLPVAQAAVAFTGCESHADVDAIADAVAALPESAVERLRGLATPAPT